MSEVYFSINLPSKCIPYSDVDVVKVRPYTGEDEIILSQISVENLDESYLNILDRIVDGIDPRRLTVGDRLYIMLWEFANSYSQTMPISYLCTHCMNRVSVVINLGEMEVERLSEDFSVPYQIKVDEKVLNVRLMNTEDLLETAKYSQNHEDYHIFQFARLFDCDEMNFNEKMEFLKSNIKALAKLRAFHSKYYHGPSMDVKVKCPREECGKEDEVSVPFRLDFLHPSGAFLSEVIGEGI